MQHIIVVFKSALEAVRVHLKKVVLNLTLDNHAKLGMNASINASIKHYIFLCACVLPPVTHEENSEYYDRQWNSFEMITSKEHRKRKKKNRSRLKKEHEKENNNNKVVSSDDETLNEEHD